MSTLCPYSITKGDDGLSVKVEWDVHYLTDEQIRIVRKYVAETEAENAKLREEVEKLHAELTYLRLGSCPSCGIKVENEELRELVLFANKTVEGLCEIVENSPGCFMCPLNQDEDRVCGAAGLYDRMRELGIEVDG